MALKHIFIPHSTQSTVQSDKKGYQNPILLVPKFLFAANSVSLRFVSVACKSMSKRLSDTIHSNRKKIEAHLLWMNKSISSRVIQTSMAVTCFKGEG